MCDFAALAELHGVNFSSHLDSFDLQNAVSPNFFAARVKHLFLEHFLDGAKQFARTVKYFCEAGY